MFTFRRPTDDDVRELLARQAGQPWSYPCVEVTRDPGSTTLRVGQAQPASSSLLAHPECGPTLTGWQIDHHRVLLGHGTEVFARACAAIRGWKMFPPEMTRVYWPDNAVAPPQQPGDVVAVLYRARPFFLWMLFPARVVYRVDEPRRYGFAYGTLPDHPERGEERFLAEWDMADDSVWYDLLAVSRPGHWLARVGWLYARYEQAKFRRLSGAAMQQACRVHE
ncbi:MAG: DUF1990 domain-containing protein [Planctomycetaceae bacterium]|nr:DUF1990 domain-containing protein [Planctomycetaceae bacterium]